MTSHQKRFAAAAKKLRKMPIIQYLRTLPGHAEFSKELTRRATRPKRKT